jgi:hypothetical protein
MLDQMRAAEDWGDDGVSCWDPRAKSRRESRHARRRKVAWTLFVAHRALFGQLSPSMTLRLGPTQKVALAVFA